MTDGPTFSSRYLLNIFLAGMALVALVAILVLASDSAQAKTITVTSDSTGKEGLIAGAIASASEGDTIQLKGGIFFEQNLTVNKGLTFTSDNLSAVSVPSIKVTARNVSLVSLSMVLTYGPIYLNGDNWTLDSVTISDCGGYACVVANHTKGGAMMHTTLIGSNGDALDMNDSSGIVIKDAFITAVEFGFNFDYVHDVSIYDARISQSALGLYLGFSDHVTFDHSVLDNLQYGILAANSTNLTFKGSLIMSNAAPLENYAIYLAMDHKVSIINNTFTADAAGIATYKSTGVLAKWNSIYGNYEGVWIWQSDITLTENAIFGNLAYNLNTTGNATGFPAPTVGNNYWGTTSESDVLKTVRGVDSLQPMEAADTTPDAKPVMLKPVPNITNGTEDTASVMLLELGPYFDDDTWYVNAWSPRPSVVKFSVLDLSDPKNVTLEVSETGTCAGTCKNAEGQLKASTAINWYGTVTLKVRATDWRGKYVDSNTFSITFNPVNDRPVLNIQGVPKNSGMTLHNGQDRVLNISVYDDSAQTMIEYRIDNGPWQEIKSSTCQSDNSTRLKSLSLCTKVAFDFKADDSIKVGSHNVSFRSCDGQLCSDEIYTGKYVLELTYTGSTGKSFSPTGVALALTLMIMIALVLAAMSSSRSDKQRTKPKGEKAPIVVAKDEEE